MILIHIYDTSYRLYLALFCTGCFPPLRKPWKESLLSSEGGMSFVIGAALFGVALLFDFVLGAGLGNALLLITLPCKNGLKT